MTFFEQFEAQWAPRLGRRRATFRRAFEFLAAKQQATYSIVETGCARTAESWEGDGQSTLLFDRFVNALGGSVLSVDIDPAA